MKKLIAVELLLNIAIVILLIVVAGCASSLPVKKLTPAPIPTQTTFVSVQVVRLDTLEGIPGVKLTLTLGDSPWYKTTNAEGKEVFYPRYADKYTVVAAPPEGYTCSVCSVSAGPNEHVELVLEKSDVATQTPTRSEQTPTRTPIPTPTTANTLLPTPTSTASPTSPQATATAWDDLPANIAEELSRLSQEAQGITWDPYRLIEVHAKENGFSPAGSYDRAHVDGAWVTFRVYRASYGGVILTLQDGSDHVTVSLLYLYEPTIVPTPTTIPATATPTITRTPTRQPTIPPVTPPSPKPYVTPLPIIYKMFDYGTDYQTTNPEYGPIGSVQWIDQRRVNPTWGVFNWEALEANLDKEAGLRVTMGDGREYPKPVLFAGILAYTSDASNGDREHEFIVYGCDGCPKPYVMHYLDKTAVIPPYDNAVWRENQYALVRAFGAKYNNDDRIGAYVIFTGIDGEAQPTKDVGDYPWKTVVMDQQYPGLRNGFNIYVEGMMNVMREAFPSKPIYINNAPKDWREAGSDYAATFDPPIGLKHSGMWYDLDSEMGYGTFWPGSGDMLRVYSNTLPIWSESPFGLGGEEERYWSYLHGLTNFGKDAGGLSEISVHPEYLTSVDPSITRWVSGQLGTTITTTPSIWCVMRDYEYPLVSWGSGGVSGYIGDFDRGLHRVGIAERVMRKDIPRGGGGIEGRQCRNLIATQTFTADPGFTIRRIELTLFQDEQEFILDAGHVRYTFKLDKHNEWTVMSFDVPECTEFTLTGASYTHKVEAFRERLGRKDVDAWYAIYMQGDNNLEYYFDRTLRGFKSNPPPDGVVVEILYDMFNGPDKEITLYNGKWEEIIIPEFNGGDPTVPAAWLRKVAARYDPDIAVLVFADHGDGFRGVQFDYPAGHDPLYPDEMQQVLSAGVQGLGRKYDIVHYDACLMASVEMAYITRPYADYMLAYANLGWSLFAQHKYAHMLQRGTPAQIAVNMGEYYLANLTGPRNATVLSLNDLNPVLALVRELWKEDLKEAAKVAYRFDNASPHGNPGGGDWAFDLPSLARAVGLDAGKARAATVWSRNVSATMPGGGWTRLRGELSIAHRAKYDATWEFYVSLFPQFCADTGWCARPPTFGEGLGTIEYTVPEMLTVD